MAKARQIGCDDLAAPPDAWLAEVLQIRFNEVVDHAEATSQKYDVRGIHDTRVAVRRLRTVLRDYEDIFEKPGSKHAGKDLKELSDRLGVVRDADVAMIELEDLRSSAEEMSVKGGIHGLIAEHRKRREKALKDLKRKMSPDQVADLSEAFGAAMAPNSREPNLFRPTTLLDAGRELISSRARDLVRRSKAIYSPEDSRALHKLRIRCKRLRYAIELFSTCFGDELSPFAKSIARMQSRLGELHDCDVWIEDMSKRLKSGANASDKTHAAETWLLSEFVKKRARSYRSALELYTEWETSGFFKDLKTAAGVD